MVFYFEKQKSFYCEVSINTVFLSFFSSHCNGKAFLFELTPVAHLWAEVKCIVKKKKGEQEWSH